MSWNDAYSNGGENNGILMNIQDQWHCQGFSSLSDHPASIINLPIASENTVVSPCYPFLAQTFGSVVFIWGIGLWVVKLIQVRISMKGEGGDCCSSSRLIAEFT